MNLPSGNLQGTLISGDQHDGIMLKHCMTKWSRVYFTAGGVVLYPRELPSISLIEEGRVPYMYAPVYR